MILYERIGEQAAVREALRQAGVAGRVAHAYLFWGPPGVGKLRGALALGQQLLCGRPQAPCGACTDCSQVARLAHPDLHLLLPARRGASEVGRLDLEAYAEDPYHILQVPRTATIGIERIRDLKLESSMARVGRGNRVILIRDAERMTPEAAQAALKLIEEPRPDTFLVLTAIEPARLLPTIVSRCQRVRFQPLPRAFLVAVLRERHDLAAEEAALVAGLAQGSLSRARSLAEEDARAERDAAVLLIEAPVRDPGEVARRAQAQGRAWDLERAERTVDFLLTWYSDVVALQHGLSPEQLIHRDREADLARRAVRLPIEEIKRRITILEEMLQAIRGNINPLLALQAALLRLHEPAGGGSGAPPDPREPAPGERG